MSADDGDFTYELLTDEQRQQIIDGRLSQYEAEHYATSLNRRTLEQATDVTEADKRLQLDQLDRVLASLESSIRLHREERAALARGA